LQFTCVGFWAGVTYLRYTVLTSPNKGETAVHCCDPTLSVLVMLVSLNVFHVVSALQSIACLNLSPRYSLDTDQQIACCDSCQSTIAWTPKIKDVAIVMVLLSQFSQGFGVRTDGRTYVRTYGHSRDSQNFSDRSLTKFSKVWGSARAGAPLL